jgi:hypothetical protein
MPAISVDQLVGLSMLGIVLSIIGGAFWIDRAPRAAVAQPSPESGFTRWLTPFASKVIPSLRFAEHIRRWASRKQPVLQAPQVAATSARVAIRMQSAGGSDPRDIARRTGLARDAVTLMLASADHRREQRRTPPRESKAVTAPRSADTERAMSAPGAQRAEPSRRGDPETLGSRFNTRLS